MQPNTQAYVAQAIQPRAGRVAMAMSGGVDSAVAAALMHRRGWDIVGVHLKLHQHATKDDAPRSCCSLDDSLGARAVCASLGVPFYVLDFTQQFQSKVVDYFVQSYTKGLTPNPCVMCNTTIKHPMLLEKVREFGCQYLATGHYAKVVQNPHNGLFTLRRPKDRKKDQTYFLFHLRQQELARLIHPLADLEKAEVRTIAKGLGFKVWSKPDSQQVCFAPKNYRPFIASHLPSKALHAGRFVSMQGHDLGPCQGVAFYTVGQRRGLGLSANVPYYVVKIKPESHEVVLGVEENLMQTTLTLRMVNWLCEPPPPYGSLRAKARVRYGHAEQEATIWPLPHNRAKVAFDEKVRAIAPGQACVFYADDAVLGGGWIEPF